MIPSERAPQGEHNDTNFSFIAPSSEEYLQKREVFIYADVYVHVSVCVAERVQL